MRISRTHLSAIHVLDSRFLEQEVNVSISFEGPDELWLVQPQAVVLLRSGCVRAANAAVNCEVGAGKVRGAADVVAAILRYERGNVGSGIVRTLGPAVHRLQNVRYVLHLQ